MEEGQRKQGGFCTGITQNVVDLLQNYTGTAEGQLGVRGAAETGSDLIAEVGKGHRYFRGTAEICRQQSLLVWALSSTDPSWCRLTT